jgi:hypothetical protein
VKRIDDKRAAYAALNDSLDGIKAVQYAANPASGAPRIKIPERAWKALAEARAALDVVCAEFEKE